LKTGSSDTYVQIIVFDSIRNDLRPDKYYYGDTTSVQTISLHRLLEKSEGGLMMIILQ
jgi:hypothetical protein